MLGAIGLVTGARGQPAAPGEAAKAEPLELSVMTYNIRYGTAPDGPNAWDTRRDLLIEVIKSRNPDVLSLQEALRFQLDQIGEALPQYAEIGVGRDNGKTAGEYAAILYRLSRFEPVESGTFWLSDTPGVAGSKTWGNRVARICTWANLREKAVSCPVTGPGQPMNPPPPQPARQGFWVYNVHLDHESQPSRARSVEMLAERIGQRKAADEPVVLCGDFNSGEANPAVRYLKGEVGRASDGALPVTASPRLVDTFRALHPEERVVGTFNNFKSPADEGTTHGDKIDYIFVQPAPAAETIEASIDRTDRDGRFPSDHFPVVAKVRLRPPAGPAR